VGECETLFISPAFVAAVEKPRRKGIACPIRALAGICGNANRRFANLGPVARHQYCAEHVMNDHHLHRARGKNCPTVPNPDPRTVGQGLVTAAPRCERFCPAIVRKSPRTFTCQRNQQAALRVR
jgi:hypothetical protein